MKASRFTEVCGPGAGMRQAEDPPSDVVMSAVVDSGRERGRGNIDANDPKLLSMLTTKVR